ncbi:hypothetical protein Pla110_18320 [Polystyrenella longa]|uniref:Glycosyl hydrolase family 32 N-terminal domain-containing protein n=1 Tax=Polystyrenella longa TaxID=2528007 RepID=A0A518CLK9_9PLAN|nr:hypothetical protein [Polystyrenella longa]QDU80110.1 hypothetical protein Pla110_18320 [Polystyrenella longa]
MPIYVHRYVTCAVLLLVLATFAHAPTVAEEVRTIPVGQRQLFLDATTIQEIDGLHSTMHSPTKRGAVLKPDVDSDGSRVQTYGTIPMWSPEENIFRMVYMAFPMENHNQIGAALATSKDGIHWTKPNLDQGVTVRGSSRNNRVFVERDLRWGDNALFNVIYDASDPDPGRRYKGLLGVNGRFPVVSGDCIHWTKSADVRIPSGDTSTLTYDEDRHRYLAILKSSSKYGRAAALSVSTDFDQWSNPRLCFSTDDQDQQIALDVIRQRIQDPRLATPLFVDPEPTDDFKPPKGHIPTWRAECYSLSVFPYEGVYIGLPMIYYPTGLSLPDRNNTVGFHHIQLAMSRDLTDWKRLGDRKAFIAPSAVDNGLTGVFDRQQLMPPSRPLVMGEELWFYYTGFKTRIPPYTRNSDGSPRDPSSLTAHEQADLEDGWAAICLAVLRRDGFISLDAGEEEGTLLTTPFILDGNSLRINADAESGSIIVSVLDEAGQTIAVSEPVTGDHTRAALRWSSGDLKKAQGKAVSLRFTLRQTQLYSFWYE